MSALEARHLADLTFPEVSRALRALSSAYVERRARLTEGAALSGAGKRAAFALFYGPLHFLMIRHIATALGAGRAPASAVVDLGCGTGAAGAAYAVASGAAAPASSPSIVGIDRHPWALAEAAQTYRAFGLKGRTVRGDIAGVEWPVPARRQRTPAAPVGRIAVVAAFAINELGDADRAVVMRRLFDHAGAGDTVLVVEPLAGFVAPWWGKWRAAFEEAGGRADQWRARIELPAIVSKLDRAAGLDHRELTARTLSIAHS